MLSSHFLRSISYPDFIFLFISILLASEATSRLAKLRRSGLGPGLPPTRQVRGGHQKRPQHGWRLPVLERLHALSGQWASPKISSYVLHSWWAICPWIRQRISWTPVGCKWTGKFFQYNSWKFLKIKINFRIHQNIWKFFKNGILLPKLFWPTVRRNCSSDREKLLKFEAEGREFAKILRSLEQFLRTVKGENNFW